jgi:hypothetical protein
MVGILVHYSSAEDPLTKFIAIQWVGEFVTLAKVVTLFVVNWHGAQQLRVAGFFPECNAAVYG